MAEQPQKTTTTAAGQETIDSPIAKREPLGPTGLALIRPIATPAQLLEQHDAVAELVQNALTKGTDYGTIPGTGDKPTLLKPGAEKLCLAFGAHAEFELVESQIDHHADITWLKRKKDWYSNPKGQRLFKWVEETGRSLGIYRYRYLCRVVLSDGRVIGTSEGVASTLESKYVDRPRDSENTVCKMAQKRAFVGAVLHAFALSNRFTADIEDQDPDVSVDAKRREDTKGKGAVYDGSAEQQKKISDILKKKGVPEEYWEEIDKRLRGRPSGDVYDVIEQVRTASVEPA